MKERRGTIRETQKISRIEVSEERN